MQVCSYVTLHRKFEVASSTFWTQIWAYKNPVRSLKKIKSATADKSTLISSSKIVRKLCVVR
jgi:hypothetical protein